MLTRVAEAAVSLAPLRYQNVVRQFIKFGIVGTIGAVVDFTVYNILTRGFQWQSFYAVWGQKILVANNISVFLAIVSNFILNKYWTFKDRDSKVAGQWASYFTLNFFTWILNQLLVSFLTFKVIAMQTIFGDQRDNAAKALAIGIILFVNFSGSKLFVFKRKQQPVLV